MNTQTANSWWFALDPDGRKIEIPKELYDVLLNVNKGVVPPNLYAEVQVDYLDGQIHAVECHYRAENLIQKSPMLEDLAVQVRVDPRVELLNIVFHLARDLEHWKTPLPDYHRDIDKHFCRFIDHPAVALVRCLTQENRIGFRSLMSMGMHLSQPPELELVSPAANQRGLENAVQFSQLLQDFYHQSGFEAFFASHEPLYKLARKQFASLRDGSFSPSWYRLFYAQRPQARFHVLLGLTHQGKHTCRIQAVDGTRDDLVIIGTSKTDDTGSPTYDHDDLSRMVREFNYLFLYPLVDHYMKGFASADRLYSKVRESLDPKGYSNSQRMVYESLARAARILYFESAGEDVQTIQDRILREQLRGFLWIDELCKLLRDYDSQRVSYHNFNSFMGQVKRFFWLSSKNIDKAISMFRQNPAFFTVAAKEQSKS